MISAINPSNNKVNFGGTTIIKQAGYKLSQDMRFAVDMSTLGLYDKNIHNCTVVILSSEAYAEKEARFLKELREKQIDYVNSTKAFDWKKLGSFNDLAEMVKTALKSRLL